MLTTASCKPLLSGSIRYGCTMPKTKHQGECTKLETARRYCVVPSPCLCVSDLPTTNTWVGSC